MLQENANTSTKFIENASEVTNVARQSIENLLNSIVAQLPYILAGLLVLLLFWLAAKVVKSIFWAATKRTHLDDRLRILFSRLIVVMIVILGIFTALTVIIPTFSFGDLITGLGFTSVVIGFATKDILSNLLSGVLILWQQPFQIGDYVSVGSNQGKVEYIGVRASRLRKDDGELVLIPNGDMYSSALTIRGAGAQRRMNLKISIGYKANVTEAKTIIRQVLANSNEVESDPKPNVYVADLASDGVNLSIYFWINTDKNSPIEVFDRIATEIKETLQKAEIELYPA